MDKTVLIIDDDLAFSEMLTAILQDEGFTVHVANDGATGLETALKLQPDLVMLDVMMPRMSGIEALAQIRKDTWGAAVPAILLTNMTQPEAIAATQEKGPPTEYLLKTDWTLDQIAEHIKQMLA